MTDNQVQAVSDGTATPSTRPTSAAPAAATDSQQPSRIVFARDGVAVLEAAVHERMQSLTSIDLANQGISNKLADALAKLLPKFEWPLQHISVSGACSTRQGCYHCCMLVECSRMSLLPFPQTKASIFMLEESLYGRCRKPSLSRE